MIRFKITKLISLLLAVCCVLVVTGCGKNMSEVDSSFTYIGPSVERGESFLMALTSFLKTNGFTPAPAPTTWGSDAGAHEYGAPDVWWKGSFHGSKPFLIRYYITRTPPAIDVHAFVLWNIHGTDTDAVLMKNTTHEFSKSLQTLAMQFK